MPPPEVRADVRPAEQADRAREEPHGSVHVRVRGLRQGLCVGVRPQPAPQGGAPLQVQKQNQK